MSEKDFWLLIRQALLTMVRAIEKRYKLGRFSDGEEVELEDSDNVTINML
jgi:hypothetical protein